MLHGFREKFSSDEPFWLMRRHLSRTDRLKHPCECTEAAMFGMHALFVPEAQTVTRLIVQACYKVDLVSVK